MPFKSPFPDLQIPESNLLSYLFPQGSERDNRALWINADERTKSLSTCQVLATIKRFASGLDQLNVSKGSTVMVVAPNNIYVPVVFSD